MSAKSNIAVLIVAAGRGTRLKTTQPKQYLELAGAPILRHALSAFTDHPAINLVQVVISTDDKTTYEKATKDITTRLLPSVIGGATRQASVLAGLKALVPHNPDLILVHDGARPFVSNDIISRVVEGLAKAKAVTLALPVVDTIKQVNGNKIEKTLDRAKLMTVQTPQGFDFQALLEAHKAIPDQALFTDDAAIAEHAGLDVICVEGDRANIKITTQADLEYAHRQITADDKMMQTHIGQGFDVHRFGPGNKLILCGVEIPHTHSLVGHSDADAGLHALTDALLGTIGEGDIGTHFPPSDKAWKDAPSSLFLDKARDLIAERGGTIINADLTLICEAPKIGPHRPAMRAQVAEILKVDISRISIKATTSEGLGFTGRKEGIAAQAIASVSLPKTLTNR